MNQEEYLDRFRKGIATVPAKQAEGMEAAVRTQLEQGLENGMNDSTLSGILGSPEALAMAYVKKYTDKHRPKDKLGKRLGLSAAILVIDLLVGLPVVLLLTGVWIFLVLGVPVILAGGLLLLCYFLRGVIPPVFFLLDYPQACLYGGIACVTGGLAMAIGSTSFGQWVMHVVGLYLDFNMDIFAGRRGL